MTDRTEPALTPEQWQWARDGALDVCSLYYTKGTAGAVIAIVNDELPDTDPRKITRAKVELLRDAILDWNPIGYPPFTKGSLKAFCAALESYLPPEP